MSQAAATLGLPVASFAFEGRAWPLRCDFYVEAVFGTYLGRRAADFLAAQRDRLGEAAFRLGLRELALAAAAGEFDWESEACGRAWSRVGSPGWRHLCFLCLSRADPAARPELVDRACEAGRAAELDAALAVALDPLGKARSGSASPSAPSPPGSGGGASAAGANSPGSTAATSPA